MNIYKRGLTLIELLLAVAVLAVLASAAVGFYGEFAKGVELNSVVKSFIFELKNARSKAMAGEDGLKWGVRVVNNTSDYYEIFSTPTNYSSASTTIKSITYLSVGIIFSTPPESSSTDIIFSKISGSATSTLVVIESKSESKTITITSNGNVY